MKRNYSITKEGGLSLVLMCWVPSEYFEEKKQFLEHEDTLKLHRYIAFWNI